MPNTFAQVDQFVAKQGVDQSQIPLLNAFAEFLKSNGNFLEGDLKKQFIEIEEVTDRNGVPLEVSTCLVCNHQEFEVKADEKKA